MQLWKGKMHLRTFLRKIVQWFKNWPSAAILIVLLAAMIAAAVGIRNEISTANDAKYAQSVCSELLGQIEKEQLGIQSSDIYWDTRGRQVYLFIKRVLSVSDQDKMRQCVAAIESRDGVQIHLSFEPR